jgi:hypothetical protein
MEYRILYEFFPLPLDYTTVHQGVLNVGSFNHKITLKLGTRIKSIWLYWSFEEEHLILFSFSRICSFCGDMNKCTGVRMGGPIQR